MEDRNRKSLEEVHGSVDTTAKRSFWGKILAFFGPAYLVSVGYMDPGNWATDLEGGSKYGYTLVWVLLMSNLMALLLQGLSARLGLVSGRDLAQASRESYPPVVNWVLYLLAEIAIAACDLAEVLGMAIGLQLLFHLPLLWGVSITVLDTILLLFLQRLGMRKMEMFIISLVAIIGMSFFVELVFAKPDPIGILSGFKPAIPDAYALYILIGIIGATVMPHNLYLHSSLVQTRKIGKTTADLKRAIKFSTIDSTIALNIAFLVNASILILGASVFYTSGHRDVVDLRDAHRLLQPLLGAALAPILFAVALIASGQSSTITGTLAGQIIMEGYLHLRIPLWIRRLVTRMLAVLPAFFVILMTGEKSAEGLLIFSQVILSMQLGFAVIPLIHFVSDKKRMGEFAISIKTKITAWTIAFVIVGFNAYLVRLKLMEWSASGLLPGWAQVLAFVIIFFLTGLLLYIAFEPAVRGFRHYKYKAPHGSSLTLEELGLSEEPQIKSDGNVYHKIAITVDFSPSDGIAIRHAIAQGGKAAEYILLHVLESPGAMLSGREALDMESLADTHFLEDYERILKSQGYTVRVELGYGRRSRAIPKMVKDFGADLVVMAAHGHTGFKDLIFGETINTVRHHIDVPLLAVKAKS